MKIVPKNILVMHTGGWIGDMILLTPTLRALRKQFPGSRISMLLLPLVWDLMERNPYVDEIIVYDKRDTQKGLRQMWKMADRLRSKQFDIAIILHPNSIRSGILAYISGIPERIGTKLQGNSFFLTTKVKRQADIHEVHRYLNIISPVVGTNHDGKLEFWGIKDEDEEFANRFFNDSPIIGINVSTTWPSKQWQLEKFARLIDLLSYQFGARVVLTGAENDVKLGNEIMKHANVKTILNLAGRTTLWQLGALIKRCDLYITCDSGPMHISAALGTPTIALFGPTDPVRHRPYGEGHVAIRKDTGCDPCYHRECKNESPSCMQAIQVEDIMEVAEKFFSSSGG